jgi:hypothetical protein
LLRSGPPALDLDSLYGRGPEKDLQFHAAGGLHIKTGITSAGVPCPPVGLRGGAAAPGVRQVPQRVADNLAGRTPSTLPFNTARDAVVKHHQWMLATDFLPRIVEPAVVTDVFTDGRRFFEVPSGYDDPGWYPVYGGTAEPGDRPTMPDPQGSRAQRTTGVGGRIVVRGLPPDGIRPGGPTSDRARSGQK